MIKSFRCKDTQALFLTGKTQRWPEIASVAERKLMHLHKARELRDLASPPGNRLERLKGDRAGNHSIRINDQWRICFTWTPEGPEGVEIVGLPRVGGMVIKNGMRPIHPGEILREDFLVPLGMSVNALAKELHVPTPRINDIVLERRSVSADTALRLARYFDSSPEFWMGLQAEYELRKAEIQRAEQIAREVSPRRVA